jgi:hypothetical protein
MIALSYSRLQNAQCPMRFDALYISKTFTEPESEPMRVGSAVHECLEKYLRHCFATSRESDLQWFDTYQFPEDISEKCQAMIATFRDRLGFQVPIGARWHSIEAQAAFNDFLLPLPGPDGWFSKQAAFRTVVDFAYVHGDTMYVVDWKTGRGDPDPFQTEIYAYLVPKLLPDALTHANSPHRVTRVACVFGELAKGRMNVAGEYELRTGASHETHQRIVEWIERVNSWKEFPAVACDKCRWCQVPGCPIKEQPSAALVEHKDSPVTAIPKEIFFVQDAEKALLFIQFAEGIIDQVKELLRAWVEKNGPVAAGGKRAELRPNDPWKPGDVERILKTLVAYGIPKGDIFAALGLTESALEKILKKHKRSDKLPMLLSMGERKAYKPRFGIYNAKEDEY